MASTPCTNFYISCNSQLEYFKDFRGIGLHYLKVLKVKSLPWRLDIWEYTVYKANKLKTLKSIKFD